MKILLPYISRSGHTITSPVMSGGIEKFAKNIFELFPESVIPVEITRDDRTNKKTKQIYLEAVKNHNPDIIIINDIDSYFLIPQMEYNIPTILIIHEPLVRDIRYLKLFGTLQKFVESNGHLYFVSENQFNHFDNNTRRITGSPLIGIKGYINSSFSDGNEEVYQELLYDAITIGRTDVLKNPFYVHKKLHKTDVSSCVITNKDNYQHSSDQIKYFESNLHWDDPQYTFRGLSYADTMEKLSLSGCYVSTCPNESWGITVLEALTRGIPCILITDKSGKHSSQSIPVSEDHYRIVHKSIKSEDLAILIKELSAIPYDKRVEMSRLTKEKHSMDKWKTRLEHIFHDRISDNKKQFNNLDEFL